MLAQLGIMVGSYSIHKHPSMCLFPFIYKTIIFPPLL